MRIFRIKFYDRYLFDRNILLESNDILDSMRIILEREKISIQNIYSISEIENDEYIEIREKKERFKRFRRYIENYIYNEIDLDDFNISDYFNFLDRFYSFDFEYSDNEFRFYIENLNEELRKILDL